MMFQMLLSYQYTHEEGFLNYCHKEHKEKFWSLSADDNPWRSAINCFKITMLVYRYLLTILQSTIKYENPYNSTSDVKNSYHSTSDVSKLLRSIFLELVFFSINFPSYILEITPWITKGNVYACLKLSYTQHLKLLL